MSTPTIITYQTSAGGADANAELVGNVFRELRDAAPDGVRYAVFRTPDGTFFHLFAHADERAGEALTDLPAFAAFVSGGPAHRATPPQRHELTLVGNYGMLAE